MKNWLLNLTGYLCLWISPLTANAVVLNGTFDGGFQDWEATGTVTVEGGSAILWGSGTTTGKWETTLSWDFTIPEHGTLEFLYAFEFLGPDRAMEPYFEAYFRDSFQVEVDAGIGGYSIVPLAWDDTLGFQPVAVDLTSFIPGTLSRMVFTLLDEDDERLTRALLKEIRITGNAVPEPATLILLGSGMISLFAIRCFLNRRRIDRGPGFFHTPYRRRRSALVPVSVVMIFGTLSINSGIARGETVEENVNSLIRFTFSSPVFNSRTQILSGKMTVTNISGQDLYAPLKVMVTGVSDVTVRVTNPGEMTPEGIPVFDISGSISDGTLHPGETTLPVTLSFYNPNRVRFRWDQDVWAYVDSQNIAAGPVIDNLCLAPGEDPMICEFDLDDFEIKNPEFERLLRGVLPAKFAQERIRVYLFDDFYETELLQVFIQGQSAMIRNDGTFQAEILLEDGPNTIDVIASNPGGVTTARTLKLSVDTRFPEVRFIDPVPDSLVTEAVQSLRGSVDDMGISQATLILNGTTTTVPVMEARIETPVLLTPGSNLFRLEVSDPAGNRGTANMEVFRVDALEGTIEGRILSSPLKAPLSGATVRITESLSRGMEGTVPQNVSGADGYFRLTGVPSGNLRLFVSKEEYADQEIPLFLSGGETPLFREISLIPKQGKGTLSLTGVVQDSSGVPIAGADVSVSGFPEKSETGPDGVYLLTGLPRTFFSVHVNREDYDPAEISVPGGTYGPSITVLTHSFVLPKTPSPVSFQSPRQGEVIRGSRVTVIGEIRPEFMSKAGEVQVWVNDIPAVLSGGRFVVNHLALIPGFNILRVEVMSPSGFSATETVSVESLPAEGGISLYVSAETGTALLDTVLRAAPLPTGASYGLKVEGPAPMEVTGSGGEYRVLFTEPGVYHLTLTVDDQGEISQDDVAVTIFSKDDLELVLQRRWVSMIQALSAGATDTALEHFTSEAAFRYRKLLNGIGETGAPFFTGLPVIHLVEMKNEMAQARLLKDGLTYYIWFLKDVDGSFKIHRL
jgi:hypothetical protein